MAKKLKCYSVMLEGQGDVTIALVNKGTWDWITKGGKVPQNQIDRATKAAQKDGMESQSYIDDMTSADGDNDRALSLCPDYGELFTDLKEYTKFAIANNVEVLDEYEGYIY